MLTRSRTQRSTRSRPNLVNLRTESNRMRAAQRRRVANARVNASSVAGPSTTGSRPYVPRKFVFKNYLPPQLRGRVPSGIAPDLKRLFQKVSVRLTGWRLKVARLGGSYRRFEGWANVFNALLDEFKDQSKWADDVTWEEYVEHFSRQMVRLYGTMGVFIDEDDADRRRAQNPSDSSDNDSSDDNNDNENQDGGGDGGGGDGGDEGGDGGDGGGAFGRQLNALTVNDMFG